MQIKQLYHLLRLSAFCLVMAMVANCADSVDFEQPQLDVSEQALTFNTQGEEKTIMVNTNCKEWIATSPKQWIHLTPNGNELIVKVDANVTGMERNSYILIDGGLAVKKITISQSADNQSLGVSGGEVVLPQVGGTTSVNVNTGDIPYELIQAESTDWLQIVKKKHSLKFISKPNYDTKERTVKLKISIGGKNTDVVVKQPGVCAFVLACNPGIPFSLYKMMNFEHQRGSLFAEYGPPDPSFNLYEETYVFRTPSPLFKEVFYVHDTETFMPTRIFTRSLVKEGVDAVRSQEFQDFVKANGYVRDTKDPNHYINKQELMTMDVDIMESNNSVVLFFWQMHIQDRDYETFKSLELGPLHLLNKADKKLSAIDKYEKSQNSEEIARQVSKNREIEAVAYKTTDPLLITRTYFLFTRGGDFPAPKEMVGSVEQYSLSYSNPNLGIWRQGKEWFVTREFDKLLTSNNFEFIGYNGKHHVYARRSDCLTLAISGDKFADINAGQPVMQISVLYKPDVFAGSKTTMVSKVERMLKKENRRKLQ